MGVFVGLLAAGQPAAADSQFLQGDFSSRQSVGVAVVEQGRITYGVTWSYEDSTTALVSALWSWKAGSESSAIKLRLGPVVKFDDEGQRAGLRGTAERYLDFGANGLFLLAEHVTVDQASFLLASWSDHASGLGGEISLYKEAEDEVSPALALTARVPDTRLTLRAGYKPRDERVFLGFSYSTY